MSWGGSGNAVFSLGECFPRLTRFVGGVGGGHGFPEEVRSLMRCFFLTLPFRLCFTFMSIFLDSDYVSVAITSTGRVGYPLAVQVGVRLAIVGGCRGCGTFVGDTDELDGLLVRSLEGRISGQGSRRRSWRISFYVAAVMDIGSLERY